MPRLACAFLGLLLLFCLLMGVSGLRMSLVSTVSGSGLYVLLYFLVGIAFLFVGSLLMRGYRNTYRRYLQQPPAEFRGAFGLRGQPSKNKSSMLMTGGVLLSFLSIIPLWVLGYLPWIVGAVIAFAMAFDVGQQRKMLRKLAKEGHMPTENSPPPAQAASAVAPSRDERREAAVPPAPQRAPRSGLRRRYIALLAGFAVLMLLLLTQAWPQYQWAALLNTKKSYESFEQRFPEGELANRAREKLHRLRDDEVWAAVGRSESLSRGYVRDYPDGKHRDEARQLIEQLTDEEWRRIASNPHEYEIRGFLDGHPDAPPQIIAEANALISKLISDEWRRVAASPSQEQIEDFLKKNPGAPEKIITEARALLAELAQADWKRLSTQGSVEEIQEFLEKFPGTPNRFALETRLDHFFNDWKWVREQDSLEHYQRFISRFPQHPFAKWMEKRIIDLEVADIAAGDHGKIPPVEAQKVGGATAEIEAKNDTGYELTLRYSGPDSVKLVIPAGKTGKATLPPGRYQVAGSVAAASVNNYYGSEEMEGGYYSWNFYIEHHYER